MRCLQRLLLRARGIIELPLELVQPLGHDPLVRGREIVRSRRREHSLKPLVEMLALLHAQAYLRIELAEVRIDLGQQRIVVLLAQADDVLEGAEAGLPRNQPRAQVLEVEIVRKRRLEVVRGHQRHQVVGLGRLRQRAQPDHPVPVLLELLAQQRLQELALADAVDRCIDSVELVGVGLESVAVHERRAAVYFQLAVGERRGEQRFLHGGVGHLALGQDVPGDERAFEVSRRDFGPARAQQRLVGERSFEPHAIEGLVGALIVGCLEQHRSEDQVRLVANGLGTALAARDSAGAIELLDRLRRPAILQQRDPEVVRSETGQAFGALQVGEDFDRIGGTPERHVDVGAQELDLVRDRFRHLAVDPLQRVQRVLGLVLLEVDARKAERRLVAHGLLDIAFQHCADRASGAMVHAVVELEIADVELGGTDVVVQRVVLRFVEPVILAELGIEALERVEVVPLVGVKERLPEVEVLADHCPRTTRPRAPRPDRRRATARVPGGAFTSLRSRSRAGPHRVPRESVRPASARRPCWKAKLPVWL